MKLKDIFPEEKDYSTVRIWMGLIGHDGGKARSEKKRKACAENIKKRWAKVWEQARQAEPGK